MEQLPVLPEWPAEELKQRLAAPDPFYLFIFTPLCGTCKAAERMLSVALALTPGIAVAKTNIFFIPELAQQWRIESVPSLMLVRNGNPSDRIYAFRSVEHVRNTLLGWAGISRLK